MASEEAYSCEEVCTLFEEALGDEPFATVRVLQLDSQRRLRSLGSALHPCVSLTALSLARCGLTNLEGLHTLKSLTHLGVYYNNITELAELQRLSCHSKLIHLDLRLNPVTRAGTL